MKKLIYTLVAVSVWGFGFWFHFYEKHNSPQIQKPIDIVGFDDIEKKGTIIQKKNVDPVIFQINETNVKIKSFSCKDLKVKLKQGNNSYGLDGYFIYEKPLNFRMVLKSIRGVELDIGSNNTHFWFWSKSMRPAALYYARHGHAKDTRLRDPFDPVWIMSSLGIETLNLDAKFVKTADKIYVSQDVISPRGRALIRSAVITDKISAYYLFNKNNQFVTITQISRDSQGIPNKIYTSWKEEDVSMEFIFDNAKINTIAEREMFVMPNHAQKIDLEHY